ncbi:type III toxin-antitoxin system ToxN/AbiQ family toxin [Clostridium sp.]|uniref:type III toxin-antitoxin system ToxN/AbiQ family toxin n=1 Tax=Clostridium sp. TaxID=1506 RepID=UPI001EC91879|nr:type III toxin-antitoxin system ToxN/AbiQ family toxin [Clostridium sp.]MBS5886197.1 type III toxin-antitoxin system ToxN/AbiQ family toxin [Clostridium sp.]
MDWYIVDKCYVEYLLKFEKKVGYVDYGDRLKLHVGIVYKIGDFNYYIPISSYKPHKHATMNNSLDFHKVVDNSSGQVYSVLNINNMIPVHDNFIIQLKYDEIELYRNFKSEKEKIDYIYLLQQEKEVLDSINQVISEKAEKLYTKVKLKPNSKLANRCCNFELLERLCKKYNKEELESDSKIDAKEIAVELLK